MDAENNPTPNTNPQPAPPTNPAPPATPMYPAPNPAPPAPTDTSASVLSRALGDSPQSSTPPTPPPNQPTALETVASGFMAVFGAIFSWIIFPILVVLVLHNFVFQAYHVLGTSMVSTLHETDYLIVSKVGNSMALAQRLLGKDTQYIPARGEVIVFHYPKDPTKVFVKRVIALPGERLTVKGGAVTVYNKANPNGFNPDGKYEAADTATLGDIDEVIQPNNIFVMGDNRTPGGSFDSRDWGELPSSYIIGNAVLRLLPLDQVRVL